MTVFIWKPSHVFLSLFLCIKQCKCRLLHLFQLRVLLLNFVFYVHLPCIKVETVGKVNMAQRDKSQLLGCVFNYPDDHKLCISHLFEAGSTRTIVLFHHSSDDKVSHYLRMPLFKVSKW